MPRSRAISHNDKRHAPHGFSGNKDHLQRFLEVVDTGNPGNWNRWRKQNPDLKPDLRGLNLGEQRRGARLGGMNLTSSLLSKAQLPEIHAWEIGLAGADLSNANLDRADLSFADLRNARLPTCRLVQANLTFANATGANLRRANLSHAVINCANFEDADLRGARVAGVNVWELRLNARTRQEGLVLEEVGDFLEDLVDTTDAGHKKRVIGRANSIEAVQLLYLIRDKRKFKTVVDAMTANVVLLLGNFGLRRKSILRALEDKLSDLGYAPVVFDFDPPSDRDLIETVSVLASLSCFVIADISQPKSTPLETMLVAPHLGVPLVTIIQKGEAPFSMFRSLQAKYDWVLPTMIYHDKNHLLRRLKTDIIGPAEAVRARLRQRRSQC